MKSMHQNLALFDLDNTLIDGDSDHAWGEFLIHKGLVEANSHRTRNNQFYQDYLNESLDINEYVAFTIGPITKLSKSQRTKLHDEFMAIKIKDVILPKAQQLVFKHKSRGDFCVIITATNSYITRPIAKLFDADLLLATDLEVIDGYYTGKICGTACYREGKIAKLNQWIESGNQVRSLANSTFYTDSVNDLPLMEVVQTPIAVDPDEKLLGISQRRGWKIISLR